MSLNTITAQSLRSTTQVPLRHFHARSTNPSAVGICSTRRTFTEVIPRTRKPNVFKGGVVPANFGSRISAFLAQTMPISAPSHDLILILVSSSSLPSRSAPGKSCRKNIGTSLESWTTYSIILPEQRVTPSSMVCTKQLSRMGGVGGPRGK